jgi:hypothetical protein
VRPEHGHDRADPVGGQVEVASPQGTSDLSRQGHDHIVLGRQHCDRAQVLASAVVAHQARVASAGAAAAGSVDPR